MSLKYMMAYEDDITKSLHMPFSCSFSVFSLLILAVKT